MFSYVIGQTSKATFSLSGGRDRQPSPENYYLSIDKLHTMIDDKPVDNTMEGECHFTLNEAGNKYYNIRCSIYNRSEGIAFKFNLNNITRFETEAFN
jgi:hypothetical protein